MHKPLELLRHSPNILSLIVSHAKAFPDRAAISLVTDEGEATRSYSELLSRSLKIATWFEANTRANDRVVLMMNTSIELVESILGAMFAGVIPVLLPVEKARSRFSRLKGVAEDCAPTWLITKDISDFSIDVGSTKIKTFASLAEEAADRLVTLDQYTCKGRSEIAFIQYTSGSTGSPKGVVITHFNLISNLRMIQRGMSIAEGDKILSWLPLHHDMGLVGMLFTPLACGAQARIFPYQMFSRNPLLWLEQCSRWRATVTGAPTFAFDLLARYRERAKDLELSCIRLLYCGSERISEKVISNFFDAYTTFGLPKESFFPCYGMAEATLYVSGGFRMPQLLLNPLTPAEARQAPTCGSLADGIEVKLLDTTERPVSRGQIGELWLKGASISPGYWQNLKDDIISGSTPESGSNWLATGDLGCLLNNEIIITGRKKDLIKVRGRNLFPEDIEASVEELEEYFIPNSVVALQHEIGQRKDGEILIVAELSRTARGARGEEVLRKLQESLSFLEIRCSRLILVSPLSLPKTSSGKKQRGKCRELLVEDQLKIIWDSEEARAGAEVGLEVDRQQEGPSSLPDISIVRNYFAKLNVIFSDERRGFPSDFFPMLKNAGMLRLLIPKDYGGLGLSPAQFSLIGKEIGEIDLSLGAVIGIQNTIGTIPIVDSIGQERKLEVLQDICSNGRIASFALTEPGAGSSPRKIAASARMQANGKLLLNGEKTWIGNLIEATYITVFANEMDVTGKNIGVSAFLLDKKKHNYSVGGEQLTVGLRAMTQARLFLKDVLLDESDRLSLPGEGLKLGYKAMEFARFGLAALSAGAINKALSLTHEFASKREIWSGLLAENAYFKTSMGEIVVWLDALNAFVAKVAAKIDGEGKVPVVDTLVCKILAGEVGSWAADMCLQFTGGRGYTETFGLSRIWRDVRVIRIFEGPTEALAFQLGALVSRMVNAAELGDENHGLLFNWFQKTYKENVRTMPPEALNVNLGIGCARALALIELQKSSSLNILSAESLQSLLLNVFNEIELRLERAKLFNSDPFAGRVLMKHQVNHNNSLENYDMWSGQDLKETRLEKLDIAKEEERRERNSPNQPDSNTKFKTKNFTENKNISAVGLEQSLRTWLETNAKVADIDSTRPLSEYGVDSLLAYELVCYIEDKHNIIIPETAVVERPSIRQLIKIIEGSPKKSK